MPFCVLFVHVFLVLSWHFDKEYFWLCSDLVVGYCYSQVRSDFISYPKRSRFMSQSTGTRLCLCPKKTSHPPILRNKKTGSVQKCLQ